VQTPIRPRVELEHWLDRVDELLATIAPRGETDSRVNPNESGSEG
jgi:hypothetical protein